MDEQVANSNGGALRVDQVLVFFVVRLAVDSYPDVVEPGPPVFIVMQGDPNLPMIRRAARFQRLLRSTPVMALLPG
jgi:hypothetical protein